MASAASANVSGAAAAAGANAALEASVTAPAVSVSAPVTPAAALAPAPASLAAATGTSASAPAALAFLQNTSAALGAAPAAPPRATSASAKPPMPQVLKNAKRAAAEAGQGASGASASAEAASAAPQNPADSETAPPRRAQRPGPPRWRFFRAVSALILREMATRYGRTPGGYLWAILEPVGGIVVMSVLFSLIARHPALGTNFMLFFATGMLSFQLYLVVANLVSAAIQFSRPLLGYPAMTLMDALIARLLLNTLTQIFTGGLIFAGIIWFYELQPVLRWGPIFLSMAMALSLAIGVGAVNAVLFTVAPVWQHFWGIFGRAQFLLSGVIFIPEMVPAQFRNLLMWNPVAHVTSEMRKGFYATYDAVYVNPTYVFSVSLVLGVFGMLFLIRFHKDIVLR